MPRVQPELKIYETSTSELLPYANNAKIHTREQVDQICASIEEFGFNDPIAAWHNADGELEIIEGHGRVMAAKKLGIEVIPVVYLDHLSDEQRRAYTHVHNQLTMNTDFDFDMLAMDMNELPEFDWTDFGFDEVTKFSAIDDLMNEEFASDRTGEIGEVFNVTFTFPTDSREVVETYIKKVGKEAIVEEIVEKAESWE